jgi:hypothetical protein
MILVLNARRHFTWQVTHHFLMKLLTVKSRVQSASALTTLYLNIKIKFKIRYVIKPMGG